MSEPDWDDQVSEASSDSLGDPLEDKHDVPIQPTDDGVTENEDEEQQEFNELTMAKKWETIMQLLITKKQVWVKESQEYGGTEDAIALKPYLKNGLLMKDPRESSESTMLHLLAKNFDSGEFTKLDGSTQLEIVTYLIDNLVPGAAQAAGDVTGEPIFKLAMLWTNKDFLLYIAENFGKEKLAPFIKTTDTNGMNCLHYAFQTMLVKLVSQDRTRNKSQTPTNKTPASVKIEMKIDDALLILKSFIQASDPESIAAKDNKGNTPIHYAVHHFLCRYLKHADYFGIVKALVEKGDILLNMNLKDNQFNCDGLSPYRYHEETMRLLKNRKKERETAAISAAQKIAKSKVSSAQDSKTNKPDKAVERGKGDKPASSQESKGLPGRGHLGKTLVDGRASIDNDKKEKDGKPTVAEPVLPSEPSGQRATRGSAIRRDDAFAANTANVRSDDQVSTQSAGEDASKTTSETRLRSQVGQLHDNTRLKPPQVRPVSGKREDVGTTISEGAILRWLKLHYIRTRPDTEAKELLYGKIASGTLFLTPRSFLARFTRINTAGLTCSRCRQEFLL